TFFSVPGPPARGNGCENPWYRRLACTTKDFAHRLSGGEVESAADLELDTAPGFQLGNGVFDLAGTVEPVDLQAPAADPAAGPRVPAGEECPGGGGRELELPAAPGGVPQFFKDDVADHLGRRDPHVRLLTRAPVAVRKRQLVCLRVKADRRADVHRPHHRGALVVSRREGGGAVEVPRDADGRLVEQVVLGPPDARGRRVAVDDRPFHL